ncbi:hypothetical protein LRF89_09565, partial [Halorhodospira sp. 9621]
MEPRWIHWVVAGTVAFGAHAAILAWVPRDAEEQIEERHAPEGVEVQLSAAPPQPEEEVVEEPEEDEPEPEE